MPIAVTDRFKAAVRQSHRVSVRATIYPADGSPAVVAQVMSGSLRLDRNAKVRRAGSIACAFDLAADVDFVRTLPFGGYVKLERGIHYADGALELVTVGYLRVNTVSWSELEGQATIEVADRFAQIQDEVFRSPYQPDDIGASDAIVHVVNHVFRDTILYHVSTNPASEPTMSDTIFESDRAAAIGDLSTSIGAQAYFDNLGDFVLAPDPPDPATLTPDWTFDVGVDGVLEEVQENLDRSAVRNAVVLKGQSKPNNPPFYVLVKDDDPASPTYWGGPFGKIALLVNLNSLMSKTQARASGLATLNERLGLARTVTFRGVPNPAIVPDDVILARYLDGREEHLRVNAITLPLDAAGSMDIVAAGHYRPDTLEPAAGRKRRRTVSGPAVWRELEGAEVVSS